MRIECDALERQELIECGKLISADDLERDLKAKFTAFSRGMMQFPHTVPWLDRETHRRLEERIRELLTDFALGRPYLRVDDETIETKDEIDGRGEGV